MALETPQGGQRSPGINIQTQGPKPISVAANPFPTLSLSLPTVQGRNSAPEESLGFLPAGVFCDPLRCVYLGSGWAGSDMPLAGTQGSQRPLPLPKTWAFHTLLWAQHARLGGGVHTCTHPDGRGPGQGCLQGPCSEGRGCEQSASLQPGPWTPASFQPHPAPPSSTSWAHSHLACLSLAATRAIANMWDQAVAKSDKGSVGSLAGNEARWGMDPLGAPLTLTWPKFTPKQAPLVSWHVDSMAYLLKTYRAPLPCIRDPGPPPFGLWTPWPQTTISTWSPNLSWKCLPYEWVFSKVGSMEVHPTGHLQPSCH